MSEMDDVNEILGILIARDGLTLEEAKQEFLEVRKMIREAIMEGGFLEEPEDILRDELGLEPDYIWAFI